MELNWTGLKWTELNWIGGAGRWFSTCFPLLYWLNQVPGFSLLQAASLTCWTKKRSVISITALSFSPADYNRQASLSLSGKPLWATQGDWPFRSSCQGTDRSRRLRWSCSRPWWSLCDIPGSDRSSNPLEEKRQMAGPKSSLRHLLIAVSSAVHSPHRSNDEINSNSMWDDEAARMAYINK